jgi:hypothetical protein
MKRRSLRTLPGTLATVGSLPGWNAAALWPQWWGAALQMQQIAWQAPWVFWSRSLMLADPRRAASAGGRRESVRMVSEKHDAALQAWGAASRVWMAPGTATPATRAARATQAALKPVRQRVAANARRLAR